MFSCRFAGIFDNIMQLSNMIAVLEQPYSMGETGPKSGWAVFAPSQLSGISGVHHSTGLSRNRSLNPRVDPVLMHCDSPPPINDRYLCEAPASWLQMPRAIRSPILPDPLGDGCLMLWFGCHSIPSLLSASQRQLRLLLIADLCFSAMLPAALPHAVINALLQQKNQ